MRPEEAEMILQKQEELLTYLQNALAKVDTMPVENFNAMQGQEFSGKYPASQLGVEALSYGLAGLSELIKNAGIGIDGKKKTTQAISDKMKEIRSRLDKFESALQRLAPLVEEGEKIKAELLGAEGKEGLLESRQKMLSAELDIFGSLADKIRRRIFGNELSNEFNRSFSMVKDEAEKTRKILQLEDKLEKISDELEAALESIFGEKEVKIPAWKPAFAS